jgi:hypothetical protein
MKVGFCLATATDIRKRFALGLELPLADMLPILCVKITNVGHHAFFLTFAVIHILQIKQETKGAYVSLRKL